MPIWPKHTEQTVIINGYKYTIPEIIDAAKGLEPFDLSLKGMNIDYPSPSNNNLRDFVSHVDAMLRAELRFPIVLGPNGVIMDGRHRLAKALYAGDKTIKAVQLPDWPEGEWVGDKKE